MSQNAIELTLELGPYYKPNSKVADSDHTARSYLHILDYRCRKAINENKATGDATAAAIMVNSLDTLLDNVSDHDCIQALISRLKKSMD